VVIGEAIRGELGPGEHAEFTLLEKKLSDHTLAGATLFTTLEPCTSRNHPKIPCVERIIERRIGKVFIGVIDPNKQIRGLGELRLRDAGIEIARFDSDLMPAIEELNRDFLRQHRKSNAATPKAQTTDLSSWAVGPNGHRIGYTKNGILAGVGSDEETPGKGLSLRRNDKDIPEVMHKLILGQRVEQAPGLAMDRERGRAVDPRTKAALQAKKAVRRLEKQYGRENWGDDFEWASKRQNVWRRVISCGPTETISDT
jgi:pyrimidine deaminase RibD-like protein